MAREMYTASTRGSPRIERQEKIYHNKFVFLSLGTNTAKEQGDQRLIDALSDVLSFQSAVYTSSHTERRERLRYLAKCYNVGSFGTFCSSRTGELLRRPLEKMANRAFLHQYCIRGVISSDN